MSTISVGDIVRSGDRNIDPMFASASGGHDGDGRRWVVDGENPTITYSFISPDSTFQPGYDSLPYSSPTPNVLNGIVELSDSVKNSIREAFKRWDDFIAFDFQEVADAGSSEGLIRVGGSTTLPGTTAGEGQPPGTYDGAGDIWMLASQLTPYDTAPPETANYLAMHEIGHAVFSLTDVSRLVGAFGTLDPSLNWRGQTIMSYAALPGTAAGQSTSAAFGGNNPMPTSPMLLDVMAAQYLFGPEMEENAGDTVYTFDENTFYFRTIWDPSGTDTFVFNGMTKGAVIDLRAGQFSDIGTEVYANVASGTVLATERSVAIAYGVTIENATGGDGNDTITGNDSNNVLTGGAGSDSISGGVGFDFLDMRGGGNNFANGGNQSDTILGGFGNDELRGGKGRDSIMGGDGNDTIYSGLGFDTLTGGAGDDVFVVRGYDARFPFADLEPTITDFQDGIDHIGIEGVTDADIATILAAQQNLSGQVGVTISVAGTKPAIITVLGVSQLDSSDVFAATDLIV